MNPLQTPFQLIRRRFPKTATIPTGLDTWIAENLPKFTEGGALSIQSRPADDFGIPKAAAKKLIPFLYCKGGSAFAFWLRDKSIAVVHLGSEGEHWFVANSFDEFVALMAAQKTGHPEIDGDTKYVPRSTHPYLGTKDTEAFCDFLQDAQPNGVPGLAKASRNLRVKLFEFMKSKETKGRPEWQRSIVVTRKRKDSFSTSKDVEFTIDWYDGTRQPFPEAEAFKADVNAVLQMIEVKTEHKLTVNQSAALTIDGGVTYAGDGPIGSGLPGQPGYRD
ncbi:MAG: hypothetical protein KBF88_13955 [Polyangiaceae bacterium]|nr:hypothetical protein [Polyangiaceae bacterium]